MRIVCWNPLSIADRDRELELPYEFAKVDTVILLATQRRAYNASHVVEDLPNFKAVHMGYDPKSAHSLSLIHI
eukprot:118137-Pyramimonas_sp.AAC.1